MACFPFSYNGKLLAAPGHEYQGACRSRWVPKIRRRRYLRLSKVNPLNPQPMSIAFLAWKKKRKKCEHSNAFYIYICPIHFHSSYKNQTANDGPSHKCFGDFTQTPKVSGSNPADPELNHLWRWAWKALHGFTIFTIHFGVICGYPAGIKNVWKSMRHLQWQVQGVRWVGGFCGEHQGCVSLFGILNAWHDYHSKQSLQIYRKS